MSKRNASSFNSERARLAGLRSGEARRRRAEATHPGYQSDSNTPAPPGGGSEEGGGVLDVGPTGASKVSEPRDLHQLSEDALVDLLKSPSETARVNAAKILHERSAPKEKPRETEGQPRVHDLAAVLRLASDAGVDVEAQPRVYSIEDALRLAQRNGVKLDPRSVILALRQVDAERRAAAEVPIPDSESPASTEAVVPPVEEAKGPSGPARFDDNGNWALIDGADRAQEIVKFNLELERRESERLVSGWVDPDKPSAA